MVGLSSVRLVERLPLLSSDAGLLTGFTRGTDGMGTANGLVGE